MFHIVEEAVDLFANAMDETAASVPGLRAAHRPVVERKARACREMFDPGRTVAEAAHIPRCAWKQPLGLVMHVARIAQAVAERHDALDGLTFRLIAVVPDLVVVAYRATGRTDHGQPAGLRYAGDPL